MTLRQIVENYLAAAGGFGAPAALSYFGLDRVELERLFSEFDEDYHISRYLHFSQGSGAAYRINGFDQTHLTIDAEIESIL